LIVFLLRTKGECCFNHIIGLPTKEGLEKPIFDYQELLYEALLSADFCNPLNHNFKDKHLWIKKATGLGVTEFFLRFMTWLCLRIHTTANYSEIKNGILSVMMVLRYMNLIYNLMKVHISAWLRQQKYDEKVIWLPGERVDRANGIVHID
jgi:hypothetical protein